jgi:hypothetical protein
MSGTVGVSTPLLFPGHQVCERLLSPTCRSQPGIVEGDAHLFGVR